MVSRSPFARLLTLVVLGLRQKRLYAFVTSGYEDLLIGCSTLLGALALYASLTHHNLTPPDLITATTACGILLLLLRVLRIVGRVRRYRLTAKEQTRADW